MRKIVLLVCFFALNNKIEAQPIHLGLRGGLAVPNIVAGSDNPLSDGYSSRFAGCGGIFTEIGLNNTFSVRFGVEYSGQGGKRNGIQAMSSSQLFTDMAAQMGASMPTEIVAALGEIAANTPPIFYADVNNTVKFDYLMIPLSLQASKSIGNSPYRIYVNAGPFVSFLMSGEQASKGSSKIYLSKDKSVDLWSNIPLEKQQMLGAIPQLASVLENGTEFGTSDITSEIRPVNVGVQGNIGFSYQCGNSSRFFIEAGGNYGFLRIQKNKENGDNSIGSANVVIGYSFKIASLSRSKS